MRALLECGSQSKFISKSLLPKLELQINPIDNNINVIELVLLHENHTPASNWHLVRIARLYPEPEEINCVNSCMRTTKKEGKKKEKERNLQAEQDHCS